jgi:hypothetical protein
MKLGLNRKLLSFFMVMIILAGNLAGFCHNSCASELSGNVEYKQGLDYLTAMDKGCPSCPANDHSAPHDCDSSCDCFCHAQLTEQPVQVVRSLQFFSIVFFEPFKVLPEVFLSKFIPPQNLA